MNNSFFFSSSSPGGPPCHDLDESINGFACFSSLQKTRKVENNCKQMMPQVEKVAFYLSKIYDVMESTSSSFAPTRSPSIFIILNRYPEESGGGQGVSPSDQSVRVSVPYAPPGPP